MEAMAIRPLFKSLANMSFDDCRFITYKRILGFKSRHTESLLDIGRFTPVKQSLRFGNEIATVLVFSGFNGW